MALTPFSQRNQSLLQRTNLSDLKKVTRMCHRFWRQVKKKDSGNVWGNSYINEIIKVLHSSQGHYFDENKIHSHGKSCFLKIQQLQLRLFFSWLPTIPKRRGQHSDQEYPRMDTSGSILSDTTSLQEVCHSTEGSGDVCGVCANHYRPPAPSNGHLPRHFVQKMENLLTKHWNTQTIRKETLFS